MKAVEVEDLWFSYGDEPVFQGASLTIEEGDFAAIIGPNGGGKCEGSRGDGFHPHSGGIAQTHDRTLPKISLDLTEH